MPDACEMFENVVHDFFAKNVWIFIGFVFKHSCLVLESCNPSICIITVDGYASTKNNLYG